MLMYSLEVPLKGAASEYQYVFMQKKEYLFRYPFYFEVWKIYF